jgi:hypothetical protein
MKTIQLSFIALVTGCGTQHDQNDSGPTDSGVSVDASMDAGGDGMTAMDAPSDTGAFPYPPALWNIHAHNAKARGLAGQYFGVQVQAATKGTVENDPQDTLVAGNTILQVDPSTGKQTKGAYYYASSYSIFSGDWWNLGLGTEPTWAYTTGTTVEIRQGMTGLSWTAASDGRAHVGRNVVVLDSFSVPISTNVGNFNLPANGVGIQENYASNKFLGLPTTSPVAVDSIIAPFGPPTLSNPIFVAGRMDGPSFNFGGGVVNGSGFFLAKYKGDLSALEWVKVFGGTPLFPASMGPSTPKQIGPQMILAPGGNQIALVFPFKGSVDFGTGAMQAGNSHGIALASFDATGMLTGSRVLQKGPAASGKISTPSIEKGTGYYLVDTVWDTVDLGGAMATAKQGADVYTAILGADFKPTTVRVYGGPGDDYGRFVTATTSMDYIIAGDSQQSIDFGLGPMMTTAQNGQAFLARLPP